MKNLILVICCLIFPFISCVKGQMTEEQFMELNEGVTSLDTQVVKIEQKLEQTAKSLSKLNEEIKEASSKSVSFGISLGYRWVAEKDLADYVTPSISPIDSQLALHTRNKSDFILSTSVIFNPKVDLDKNLKKLAESMMNSLTIVEGNANKTLEELRISSDEGISGLVFSSDVFQQKEVERQTVSQALQNISSGDLKAVNFDRSMVRAKKRYLESLEKREVVSEENDKIKNDEIMLNRKSYRKARRRLAWLMTWMDLNRYVFSRIRFSANLNVLEFNESRANSTFNKPIEGGLGISYVLSDALQIGINYEHISERLLQNDILDQEGNELKLNGQLITNGSELSIEDNDIYNDSVLEGMSIKLIANF